MDTPPIPKLESGSKMEIIPTVKAMNDSASVHLKAWFSGHVQGVGFRYSTSRIAREFEVSGSVRNLADGRVHLVVEGREAEVMGFLNEIQEQMEGYIRGVETREEEELEGWHGFSITG